MWSKQKRVGVMLGYKRDVFMYDRGRKGGGQSRLGHSAGFEDMVHRVDGMEKTRADLGIWRVFCCSFYPAFCCFLVAQALFGCMYTFALLHKPIPYVRRPVVL